MDSFHPGKLSVIFAVLFAFLSTKNGRNLGAKIIHQHIKKTFIFWLPLRVRCKIICHILKAEPHKGRKLINSTTMPWGAQWDYITKVTKGHWIAYNDKLKNQERATWVEKTAKDVDLVIYYIHGGGFKMGHSLMYMESFIHIIDYLKEKRGIEARIFSAEYGMKPEVDYHRTKEDCMNAYRYLIQDLGISAKRIVFAGDSAGGNLVASCVQTIRDLNSTSLPQPAGNVQISPWISIDGSESADPEKTYLDCLTVGMLLDSEHGNYFGEAGYTPAEKRNRLRDPAISPLYGSFVGLCPTLITYGGTEVLQHDNEKLIDYLKRDQVEVDVIRRANAPHIWIISSILAPTHDIWKSDCSKLAEWCADRVSLKQ